MSPPERQRLPGQGAPANTFDMTILLKPSEEEWVTEERAMLRHVGEVRAAWLAALGLNQRPKLTPEEILRVARLGAMVDRWAA